MEELFKQLEEAGLKVYQQQPHEDTMLLRWWMDLIDSGEVGDVMPAQAQRLPYFLNLMQPPNVLVYAADDKDIWISVWFEELFRGAIVLMGFWIDPTKRQSKRAFKATRTIYDVALTFWPNIIGVTQEHLLAVHTKAGYTVFGEFEKLWDGERPAWLVLLTRAGFENGSFGGKHEDLQESSNGH